MNDLFLHVSSILLHPLHPLLSPLLHLVGRVEDCFLLDSMDWGFVFLHLFENLLFCIIAVYLLLQLLHLSLKFTVFPSSDMVDEIKIHLLLIIIHENTNSTTSLCCTCIGFGQVLQSLVVFPPNFVYEFTLWYFFGFTIHCWLYSINNYSSSVIIY